MNAGNIATSERLQQTLACLEGGSWVSTKSIEAVTHTVAAHSDVAGLRANGFTVECKMRSNGNGKIAHYRLIGRPPTGECRACMLQSRVSEWERSQCKALEFEHSEYKNLKRAYEKEPHTCGK
jgi:hypothetical protein